VAAILIIFLRINWPNFVILVGTVWRQMTNGCREGTGFLSVILSLLMH